MNEDLIFEQMKEKAMNAEPLGGTLKLKLMIKLSTLMVVEILILYQLMIRKLIAPFQLH